MEFYSLVTKTRSYRRFDGNYPFEKRDLQALINYSRFTASAMNLQSLRYKIFHRKEDCEKIFPCLKWAGYLKDWTGPSEDERPTAYILQYAETPFSKHILCDAGIALQTILLAAGENGLGGCIFASVQKEKIHLLYPVEEKYQLLYAVAIGKPAEEVILETAEKVEYWRDEKGIHHVPKRDLKDLIIK